MLQQNVVRCTCHIETSTKLQRRQYQFVACLALFQHFSNQKAFNILTIEDIQHIDNWGYSTYWHLMIDPASFNIENVLPTSNVDHIFAFSTDVVWLGFIRWGFKVETIELINHHGCSLTFYLFKTLKRLYIIYSMSFLLQPDLLFFTSLIMLFCMIDIDLFLLIVDEQDRFFLLVTAI